MSWAAAAVLAGAATWVFWQIDDLAYWYVVPAVSAAGALAVERRASWAVAVVGSVLYAASFSWF